MKLLIRIPLLVLFLLPLAARSQPSDNANFFQKFQLAQIADAQGDYQNAARLYGDLYHMQPENPDVLNGYVRVLTALKRFSSADTLLTEALSRGDHDQQFDLYLMLGRTRSYLGHKAEALDAFNKALASGQQQNPYGLTYTVSNVMTEVGYTEEALKLLQDHRHTAADGQYYTPLIADLLFKLGRYADGTKEYLAILRANSDNPSSMSYLSNIEGRLAHFTGDTSSARTIIHTVIGQIDTESASVAELQLLGWCYGELRDYNHALDIALMIDNRSTDTGNGFDLLRFGEKALSEGAYDAASRAYSEVVRRTTPHTKAMAPTDVYYEAKLGVLRAKLLSLKQHTSRDPEAIRNVITEYANLGTSEVPNEFAVKAFDLAGDAALNIVHDPALAKPYYSQIISRSRTLTPTSRHAYFALESIALAQNDVLGAQAELDELGMVVDKRHRADDAETLRHIQFEQARIYYFQGRFDTALATLAPIVAVATSDYANDAIALQSLISENRDGTDDGAMKVFAKAELLSLGSDLHSALAGYQSIRETYPKASIADEATLRAADLMVTLGKPTDAVALLEQMQDKMTESPLLDRAAMREAEITEHELGSKDKALKLYEDFLARYAKSPLCTEVRQRARKLRGDIF